MAIEKKISDRANGQCELCGSTENLQVYGVPPQPAGTVDDSILTCQTCLEQLNGTQELNANHWRCLNEAMWSETPAVQVVSWRMLNRLRGEGWPQELLDMLYLEDDVRKWAEATGEGDGEEKIVHKDANGAILETGDTVVLIKDLVVKGGGFTAKRGTAVRRISLVADNPEHIEGKVEGQQIVILTQYVKKS